MEPDSSQWCRARDQGNISGTEPGKVQAKYKGKEIPQGYSSIGTNKIMHLWRFSRPDWINTWRMLSDLIADHAFSRRLELRLPEGPSQTELSHVAMILSINFYKSLL